MKLKRKNACDVPLGFRWLLNGWKLELIESTPANVSFEQRFLNKVEPVQKKTEKKSNIQPRTQDILPF